jgi:hypothetical protein
MSGVFAGLLKRDCAVRTADRAAESLGPVVHVAQVLDYETADEAIVYAIQKGWLIGVGEPSHSVRLTDDGRMASAQGRRR